eukprot:CAMPEP_0168509236 /NCGR_PEP_ID=MMETSP0405-20121227/646_1 /TAXON_ID=498012 /ORGANISM="Trichosphaerium sp, Strain Am-I-7 wt" /LENGTH=325 /DNA_ID=CAMNT_0008526637 /DNA_START=249 /DNA_END=1226 /DNA_ORIENTATION=+
MTAVQEQETRGRSSRTSRSLPEGLLQRMLCTAAHSASFVFAETLYTEITESYNHPLSNHQALMSLLLCYAKGGLLKRSFMHIHNQDPKFIVHPAVRYEIAKSASNSTVPQLVGFWEFVNGLGEKKPPVHYQNCLIIIQAYVIKGELDAAYSIYRSLYEQKLSKTPTPLNIMLQGSKTVGQGFRLLAEARNDEIEADAESYEHMINVFLSLEETNRAVDFLTNIPSHIKPTLRTFKNLVEALSKAHNYGHALDVIKTARSHGYRDTSLKRIMTAHGGGDEYEPDPVFNESSKRGGGNYGRRQDRESGGGHKSSKASKGMPNRSAYE